MNPFGPVVLAAALSVSAVLIYRLWRRPDAPGKKILWSLVLLVPLFGWIFYGALYKPPGRNTVRARGDASGWLPHGRNW